jgi:hypothetical protein
MKDLERAYRAGAPFRVVEGVWVPT